ncbi:permease [Roseobacter cerasinus]|uniref:Permease n=1 Tax=Roseobacter cerasinus TaxID=2602289 RepID=A0A640VTQ8_9RHOB|nr:DMT family transporter [Roseobacter cerasinus]GFE50471.1 permease [Roseobacter cerasinus]
MSSHTQKLRTGPAIFAIVAAVLALSLGDALVKWTGTTVPLWQMYIMRSAFALPVLFVLARREGVIRLHAPGWVVLRSALLVVMWVCYYLSLPLMPLSLAAAAFYTSPLFILALSAVATRRWPAPVAQLAIVTGFLGVVLIIRPDTSGFQLGTVLPVLAACLYACAMVLTASKCRDDSPLVLAFALNVAFILGGAGLGLLSSPEPSFALGPWQPINAQLLMTMAALGALILIGSVGAAFAYQNGPPATIAVFDYSYLIFSLLWGSLFFSEAPDIIALIGIAAIIGSGVLTLSPRARAAV